jgi:hypothetical protein
MPSHWFICTPLLAVLMTACSPLQGPEIDMAHVATPDPIAEQVRPAPPLTPPAGLGQWRAWVPRQTTREGDVTEGHWLTMSVAPPVIEVIEPEKPMPRAPKAPLTKPQAPAARKPHDQTPALAAPTPVFPHAASPPASPPSGLRNLLGGQ